MKRSVPVLFAFLLLASCSEGGPNAPSATPSLDGTGDEVASDDKDKKEASGEDRSKDKGDSEQKKDQDGKNTAEQGPKPGGSGDGGARNDGHRAAFNDPGSEDDDPSAAYPAPGSYVFAQSGFEKFCTGGTCERQALPERQTASISLSNRTRDRAVVVTETTASDDRKLRTTATYSRADALITDVYTRLSYKGFVFENEYHPAPPVESLRFPLADGEAWRGSWEDSTSGTYAVRVFGPTSVSVGGRAVRAWQVATSTRFKGEFRGEAKTLAWIDPATKAIVKLNGSADLDSSYGRYVTEFSTSLRSGPGY